MASVFARFHTECTYTTAVPSISSAFQWAATLSVRGRGIRMLLAVLPLLFGVPIFLLFLLAILFRILLFVAFVLLSLPLLLAILR